MRKASTMSILAFELLIYWRKSLDVVPESNMAAAADIEGMDVPDDAEGDDDIEVLEEGQDDTVHHVRFSSLETFSPRRC